MLLKAGQHQLQRQSAQSLAGGQASMPHALTALIVPSIVWLTVTVYRSLKLLWKRVSKALGLCTSLRQGQEIGPVRLTGTCDMSRASAELDSLGCIGSSLHTLRSKSSQRHTYNTAYYRRHASSLHIRVPGLLPYRYLYIVITSRMTGLAGTERATV